MFSEDVSKELGISIAVLQGYIVRQIIEKPIKKRVYPIKGGKGRLVNFWTEEQVAKAKINKDNCTGVTKPNIARNDHTPSDTSAGLLNNVFGKR